LTLLAVATGGCATVVPPAKPPAPAEQYARAPFDTVWQRTITYFANSHLPIQTIEKASGLIASTRFSMQFTDLRAWADCGNASTGGTTLDRLDAIHNYPIAFADFNAIVHATGDSTSVRASIAITATVRAPGGMVPLRCVSNGQFEKALFAYVSTAAAGQRTGQ
jgi:hypothetical protein